MPRFKLHVRVALLITGLSLLFIFIFTSIQLRNHLDRLSAYNKYRARVGTIIVKTTLEMLLKDMQTEEVLSGIFEAAIESFSREGVVEKISVISMNGVVLATNDPIVKEFGESKRDIDTYQNLSQESGQSSWFYSAVNERTKVIDIFIPLSAGLATKYIVKLSFSIVNMSQAIVDTLIPILLTVIAVVMGNLFLGFVLLKTVVWPIEVLNAATKEIASGNLDLKVAIKTNDEIQELGETFNEMTIALKRMKERAENANPLTKLPGNNIIREEVENRLKRGNKFVAVHLDLDNFKAYNDRYGISKGDEVIKFTSRMLDGAIKSCGNAGDFLGHEGGDDFFIITTPDKADAVTKKVIHDFDSEIRGFYSREDLDTGYIIEKDRRGETVKFPLMTISMAGVTNQLRPISSYAELTNIAVSIKVRAKQEKKSNFMMDRRSA
ncbi:MAG: diguanylate cyclase [Candidatus Omnitrophica bacterium]|nr:diguanylate cyclase [Candidatus Omnitrophota bacterium]